MFKKSFKTGLLTLTKNREKEFLFQCLFKIAHKIFNIFYPYT